MSEFDEIFEVVLLLACTLGVLVLKKLYLKLMVVIRAKTKKDTKITAVVDCFDNFIVTPLELVVFL